MPPSGDLSFIDIATSVDHVRLEMSSKREQQIVQSQTGPHLTLSQGFSVTNFLYIDIDYHHNYPNNVRNENCGRVVTVNDRQGALVSFR